jgi:hypothetical protein
MGLWNCSDSVTFFFAFLCIEKQIILHTFRTVPKYNRAKNIPTLSEQFQSPIEKQIISHCRNSSKECGIIGFSMGLWNCFDSVPLFGFLLGFGTVPTMWHYWLFICLLDFGTVLTEKQIILHTFRTVPKYNRAQNNATLSEQFQSPIEKQIISHCRNCSKVL